MHSFATFGWSITAALKRVPINRQARILSYLPLAHVAERTLVEHGVLATSMHVFFAESLETFTEGPAARPADRAVLGAAPVGQVPAGREREDAARQAEADAEDPDPARHRAQEDPHRARPRRMPVRRRRRRADAARAAELVREPRPADHRGLRHDRELRRLARHAARRAAARHGRPALRRRAEPHRPADRRDPDEEPRPDARLLQGTRADARRLHRRRLAAHRRQGPARRRRQPAHHRPREGPVQDQQGQVRVAGRPSRTSW